MELFVLSSLSVITGPTDGILSSISTTDFFSPVYPGAVRRPPRYWDTPPTLREMLMLLSLRMMMKFLVILDALFSASYAMPPVSAPSPMTAATLKLPPCRSRA